MPLRALFLVYKCLHCIATDGSNDGRNKKGKRSSSGSRASQSQKRGSKSRKRKKGSDPSFSEVNSICLYQAMMYPFGKRFETTEI